MLVQKKVGGVPRNSLLIMVPANYDAFPPHFTLLRVLEAAPTPLSKDVQQTYFELQKKFVSAHKYRVYAPDDDLLELITNSLLSDENSFPIGDLRLTECRLPLPEKSQCRRN